MLVDLPKHVTDNTLRLMALRRFANEQAGFYGAPVYLCGSALLWHNPDPRDWDLRLKRSDDAFALRYVSGATGEAAVHRWHHEANTGEWTRVRWHWAADCLKTSQRGCRYTSLNIDFQVYPATHWDMLYADAPRARLDTGPWESC